MLADAFTSDLRWAIVVLSVAFVALAAETYRYWRKERRRVIEADTVLHAAHEAHCELVDVPVDWAEHPEWGLDA